MKRFFYSNLLLLPGWLLGCSSSDEAPFGRPVEHPPNPVPVLSAPVSSASQSPPLPSSAAPPLSSGHPPRLSEIYEQNTGLKLSDQDKTIMDDCPKRIWSRNVPKGKCKADGQCGDGFCDRGQCAPFWSCDASYSQPCKKDEQCAGYLCIEGRCRSCISTAECKDDPDNQNPTCDPNVYVPGSRSCQGVTGSGEGDVRPWGVTP